MRLEWHIPRLPENAGGSWNLFASCFCNKNPFGCLPDAGVSTGTMEPNEKGRSPWDRPNTHRSAITVCYPLDCMNSISLPSRFTMNSLTPFFTSAFFNASLASVTLLISCWPTRVITSPG